MPATWGSERASNNADKSGHEKGGGLAVSGYPCQCGICKREEGL